MVEMITASETPGDTCPFVLRKIDTPILGVNYPSYQLHTGLVIDNRLAVRFVAAPRTVRLGFFQLQNGELVNREKVEDFRYSKNYELVYPDGWKIRLRCFMGVGGLFVCIGELEDKWVSLAEEAGIILPQFWETERY